MLPSCAETAELLDADFFTVKSIHELKYLPLWSWLPSDRLWYHQMAISRPWGRIRGYHAQKGRRSVWVHLSLVWGRRVESAVEAVRRRRSQAMCCEPGVRALKVAWLIEMVARAQSCLVDWMGACAQSCLVDWNGRTRSKWEVWWFFSSFLLQLRVDENKSAHGDTICIEQFCEKKSQFREKSANQ